MILPAWPGRERLSRDQLLRRVGRSSTIGDATISRGDLLGRMLVTGGALGAGGVLAAGLPEFGASATSPALDRRILSFLLELEYVQAAFYREARAKGALKGELLEYAEVAGTDERAHVGLLRRALGRRAPKEPSFAFGTATTNSRSFQAKAVALEELVVGAYVGQGGNLSVDRVTRAARIVSVDARHAAWIRDIAGKHPAPNAADAGLSAAKVRRELTELGLWRRS